MKYSTISFPGLGIEVNPNYKLEIGPLSIHYYGLIIALGLLLAVIYGLRRSKWFGLTHRPLCHHLRPGLLLHFCLA